MPQRKPKFPSKDEAYVTQKDVAERAGVSPSIVSYVINNGPRSISDETRQRVLSAIAELQYRPNVHAQKLMRASWNTELSPGQFGVLFGGSRDLLKRVYYPNLLVGILDEAARLNYLMRFLQFYDDLQSPILFNSLFHHEEVSALIIITASPLLKSDEGRLRLQEIRERIPNLVSLGRALPEIPSITIDLAKAAQQATEYLIALGHTRIAYLGGPNLREAGYRSALQGHQLPFDPALLFDIGIEYKPAKGYLGAQKLIESGLLSGESPVTAIMAGSDELALGCMRRLGEAGLHIPYDLSIIGIDDHEMGAFSNPSLTTIQLPHQALGQAAVQIIAQRVGHTADPPPLIHMPTELIVRESCAPPKRPNS